MIHLHLRSILALLLGAFLALGLLRSQNAPARPAQAAPQIPIASSVESALLRSLSAGADFGPGLVDGPGNASPTIIRVIPTDLTVGEAYLSIQNLGDCELLVIQHRGLGGSSQLGKILIGDSGTIVLRLAPADSIQVLGLAQGAVTRFAWSARVREPA